MKDRKIRVQTVLNILLIFLALFVLYSQFSKQGQREEPRRLRFYGEYSRDGDEWFPLRDTKLSAIDGDLFLRGHFGMQLPENSYITFYAFHLGVIFEVNGVPLTEAPGESCDYARWITVCTPRVAAGDEICIRLSNYHGLGNAHAYQDLLESFYLGQLLEIDDTVKESSLARRIAGTTVVAFSLALLAIALVFFVLNLTAGDRLWPIGLMALCYGGYLCFSAPAAALNPLWYGLTTCALYLCVIIALFMLGVILRSCLQSYRRTIATVLVHIQSILLLALCLCYIFGAMDLCRVLDCWLPIQILCIGTMLVLSLLQWIKPGGKKITVLGACVVLFLVAILETVNEFFMLWPQRVLIDFAAASFFFGFAVHGAVSIPMNFRIAAQAEKLRSDWEQNRIVLAMSQIRAHFIFNILNAISGMCKYDPQKADETVIRFARYLRGNIDVMQEDRMESFETSLRHLQDYVALEQIRFGDLIAFDVDAEVTDFSLPPLVLQPIVENAIKHGLTPKEEGGLICLQTRRQDGGILITITDDGVGFDTDAPVREGSVGMRNVRFRLKQMVKGEMHIQSAVGQGTTVTVFIPDQGGKSCE
ncbi:MAG: histidine kinase [Oscillospiraceae bacterium]|nr:histidine kinase [Oscillospiraceae bacterium]